MTTEMDVPKCQGAMRTHMDEALRNLLCAIKHEDLAIDNRVVALVVQIAQCSNAARALGGPEEAQSGEEG